MICSWRLVECTTNYSHSLNERATDYAREHVEVISGSKYRHKFAQKHDVLGCTCGQYTTDTWSCSSSHHIDMSRVIAVAGKRTSAGV